MDKCPCGSGLEYSECCGPIIAGTKQAETALQTLRARYTAHVKIEIPYIIATIHPDKKGEYDEKVIKDWAESAVWEKLEVSSTTKGGKEDSEGKVEFTAYYREKNKKQVHSEVALFKKSEGKWYFYDAEVPSVKQVINESPKIGRNDPCSCGSGKKYKKCCGA